MQPQSLARYPSTAPMRTFCGHLRFKLFASSILLFHCGYWYVYILYWYCGQKLVCVLNCSWWPRWSPTLDFLVSRSSRALKPRAKRYASDASLCSTWITCKLAWNVGRANLHEWFLKWVRYVFDDPVFVPQLEGHSWRCRKCNGRHGRKGVSAVPRVRCRTMTARSSIRFSGTNFWKFVWSLRLRKARRIRKTRLPKRSKKKGAKLRRNRQRHLPRRKRRVACQIWQLDLIDTCHSTAACFPWPKVSKSFCLQFGVEFYSALCFLLGSSTGRETFRCCVTASLRSARFSGLEQFERNCGNCAFLRTKVRESLWRNTSSWHLPACGGDFRGTSCWSKLLWCARSKYQQLGWPAKKFTPLITIVILCHIVHP